MMVPRIPLPSPTRPISHSRRALRIAGALLGGLLLCGSVAADEPGVVETDVFISGQGGYSAYRIPAAVVTKQGTVLAFCEGRLDGLGDAGNIDVLLRRSEDGGQTWSEPQVIWDHERNTCGNPCPVVDQETGDIWLLMTWNAGNIPESRIQAGYGDDSRRVYVTHSRDDGQTWAPPKDITEQTKEASWSWYATGPGAGIQLTSGDHRGRLVIPCDHKIPAEGGERFRAHVIYSDDHGQTWQLGGSAPEDQVNECEVVELGGGQLMLNMRNYDRSVPARQVALSDDGGATWHSQRHDPALIEPICQASIRRHSWPSDDSPGVILFSNPASTDARRNMTVRASYDDAQSWPVARTLHPGGSAYSCLCILDDGTIGCFYEKDGYRTLTFAQFPLEWLAEGDSVGDPAQR